MKRARSAAEMIGSMTPVLMPGTFIFAMLAGDQVPDGALATFREAEGLSVILPEDIARAQGLDAGQPMRCITLNVYSALDGVGLTAAVSGALAEAGIACNMVAAFHHDPAFVPEADAERALAILQRLQAASAGS